MQITADELKNASWDARIRLSRQEEEELLNSSRGFSRWRRKPCVIPLGYGTATFYGIKRQNVLRSDAIEPSLPRIYRWPTHPMPMIPVLTFPGLSKSERKLAGKEADR